MQAENKKQTEIAVWRKVSVNPSFFQSTQSILTPETCSEARRKAYLHTWNGIFVRMARGVGWGGVGFRLQGTRGVNMEAFHMAGDNLIVDEC